MASSSWNSSGSSCSTQLIQNNSASEADLQQELMDQRKRKRQQSNRESARRSRMRKRKHLDDLMAQVTQLSKDNNQILTSINITTQHYMNMESENSILTAQLVELSQRLQSLIEILSFVNTTDHHDHDHDHHHHPDDDDFMDSNSTMYLNQPIMA